MDVSLVGKRVRIIIGEYDTEEPPELPPGTIVRRLAGPDHDSYWLIQLDTSVECQVWRAVGPRVLHSLVVAPAFRGDSLSSLFGAKKRDYVPVSIANVIMPLDARANQFEFSQVDYLARGHVMRIG